MARLKGSKNKPKSDGNGAAAPDATTLTAELPENQRAVAGDNSEMTDDQRHVLTKQWADRLSALERRKDSIVAEIRSARKNIKAELGATGVIDVKLFMKLSSPDGEEAAKADVERQTRVMRWLGIPLGTQGDLFPAIDLRPSDEVAYAAGKRAGLEGEPCRCPHDASVPQHNAWMNGWQDGQSVLVQTKLRPLPVQDAEAAPSDDAADLRPRFLRDAVDQAQAEIRQGSAVNAALSTLAAEQAASLPNDVIDIPAEFRRA